MKKLRILLGLIFFTIIIMSINVNSALVLNNSNELINAFKNKSLVRLHVIANSNSPVDQYIKRNIRNQLLTYMGNYADKDNIQLEENIYEINNFINNILREEGINYGAKADLGLYSFPERTYQELTLPAGRYKALKVKLGKGGGANWWCVLLPPMCIEDQKNTNTDSRQIEFRFKLWEWFKQRKDSDTNLVDTKNNLTQEKNNFRNKLISINQDKTLTYKMLINEPSFYTMVNNNPNLNLNNDNSKNYINSFYKDELRFLKEQEYELDDINILSIY